MSLFQTETVPCPSCGKPVEFSVVYSLNADRRPDLRAAILDRSFQTGKCTCGEEFRLEPEMTYLDAGRKQWMLVEPPAKLAAWPELELNARDTFEAGFGASAAPAARAIGAGLQVRVTFGWAAVREKLLCGEHKLDDVALEMLKATLLRNLGASPLADDTELRLMEVEGGQLVLAWVKAATETALELLRVPRALYDVIAADEAGYQTLREQLTAGAFVDLHRLLVSPVKEEAEAGEPAA